MYRRCSRLLIVFLLLLTLPPWTHGAERFTVYVVNYPLQYFAQRIAGEHATVVFPAPSEVDPAFWMPDLGIIVQYQQADLILLNGATYAKWLGKVTLPPSRLVNTSAGFKDQYIKVVDSVTHAHGPSGEHAHADLAFTTWLDFDLAARQAKAIAAALIRSRPHLRDTFQQRYEALREDLLALDRDLRRIVATRPGHRLVASHPVYHYLARRYDLRLKYVHWEPNVIPSQSQWADLQQLLHDHPARGLIWEAEPLPSTVARLRSMGIASAVFSPCANIPKQGDFLTVMRQNLQNLSQAIR